MKLIANIGIHQQIIYQSVSIVVLQAVTLQRERIALLVVAEGFAVALCVAAFPSVKSNLMTI
jgi:hypothetical protein